MIKTKVKEFIWVDQRTETDQEQRSIDGLINIWLGENPGWFIKQVVVLSLGPQESREHYYTRQGRVLVVFEQEPQPYVEPK